jgi:YesN/AraC family two-component response regulator
MENLEAKYSVLIADDEDCVRELIEDILVETGMFKFIIHAKDGAEAWSKLQHQTFDLLILDINMPKTNGHELIKLLKFHKKLANQKVLISSGHLGSVGVKTFLENNVKDFIIKPYSPESFIEKVYGLLNIKAKLTA